MPRESAPALVPPLATVSESPHLSVMNLELTDEEAAAILSE